MRKFLLAIASTLVATSAITLPGVALAGGPQPIYQTSYYQAGPRFDRNVEVQWGSSWWPATILSASNGQYLIHYEGWSSTWDEWVGVDRMRAAGGVVDRHGDPELVSIYWGSQWYPGQVMKRDGGRFLVHYDGWSNSFDEWVATDRLRFVTSTPVYAPERPTYAPVRPVFQPVKPLQPVNPVRERPSHVRPSRNEWPAQGPAYR